MKKSLIALAALATVATAAQAQSSVTVYGIVDAGFGSTDGGASTNQVKFISGGALSSSRWGLRGTEDLGGGLAANFVLESGITTDDGASSGFTRTATVGLASTSLGQLVIGRMNRLDYDAAIAIDPFGAANIGGAVNVAYITSGIAGAKAGRVSDAAKYVSPTVSGLTATVQQKWGEATGSTSASRSQAAKLDYSAGNFAATAAYNVENNAGGSTFDKVTVIGGSYNFGVAKAFVGAMEREVSAVAPKIKSSYIGAIVPVNAKLNFHAQLTKVENSASNGTQAGVATAATPASGNDADVYALGLTYALSKRTTAYAIYSQANNDAAGKVLATNQGGTGTGVTTGQDHKAYAVGIRHAF